MRPPVHSPVPWFEVTPSASTPSSGPQDRWTRRPSGSAAASTNGRHPRGCCGGSAAVFCRASLDRIWIRPRQSGALQDRRDRGVGDRNTRDVSAKPGPTNPPSSSASTSTTGNGSPSARGRRRGSAVPGGCGLQRGAVRVCAGADRRALVRRRRRSSGTNADLLLAHPKPLDLIIVVAPMAASGSGRGAASMRISSTGPAEPPSPASST